MPKRLGPRECPRKSGIEPLTSPCQRVKVRVA
jgi:hypothetical protein